MYKNLKNLYESRKAGASHKVVKRWAKLSMAPDGTAVVETREFEWKRDPTTNKYSRIELDPKPMFTVTPDDVFRLGVTLSGRTQTERNTLDCLLPSGLTVQRDSNANRNSKYKVRILGRAGTIYAGTNIPAADGLEYDLKAGEVLKCPPDVKTKTDRKAAKPVWDHVKRVLTVMDTLHRMGALDEPKNRWVKRGAVDATDPSLSDDAIAEQAQAAYAEARSRVWLDTSTHTWEKAANGKIRSVGRTQAQLAQRDADNYARIRALAGKKLRERLKATNGGLAVETIEHV